MLYKHRGFTGLNVDNPKVNLKTRELSPCIGGQTCGVHRMYNKSGKLFEVCKSYTTVCPPVRGDNPRALAKSHGLTPRTGGHIVV